MCGINSDPVQAWAPAVQALIGNYSIPGSRAAERILRWISIESCGNQCSLDATRTAQIAAGFVPDAGVMQIYFESPGQVINGATSASLRASCNGTTQDWPPLTEDQRRAYLAPQLAWAQGAIASAQAQLDAVGANWPERDQWRWYKFRTHGLPALAVCALWMVVQQLGRAPSGWDEFKSTFQALPLDAVSTAAASPEANDCAGALGARGAWDTAWNNAEEMDLPDEATTLANIKEAISDTFSSNGQSLSGYAIFMGLLGIGAGVLAGHWATKRYLHGA